MKWFGEANGKVGVISLNILLYVIINEYLIRKCYLETKTFNNLVN